MNKEKKMLINKQNGIRLLDILLKEDCWDPYVTQFMTSAQCKNKLKKAIEEYFSLGDSTLVYWNKTSYLNIFEDKDLLEMLIYLMKDFNFHKEQEK